jgi:hypothetical protein
VKNPPTPLNKMTNEQLQAIVDLTEARILKISKDDLRMDEQQLLWSDDLAKEVIDYWLELNDWWLKKKIPPCTCADHENGFLAREAFNPYYFEDEPCSIKWMLKWKKEQTDAAS